MRVEVKVEAAPDGHRVPCGLSLDGREISVTDVLDHWPGIDHRYFKVRCDDGNVYILRLDERRAQWELILFQTPRGDALGR